MDLRMTDWTEQGIKNRQIRAFGFNFAIGLLNYVWMALIALIAAVGIMNFFNLAMDDSDFDGFNRSGVEVVTDYKTGWQYLKSSGGIIPRLDADGKHLKVGIKRD